MCKDRRLKKHFEAKWYNWYFKIPHLTAIYDILFLSAHKIFSNIECKCSIILEAFKIFKDFSLTWNGTKSKSITESYVKITK